MSLFGYPAKVTHYQAVVDAWGRISGFSSAEKAAKVIEEQRLIKNARGEEVQIAFEIHLEGQQAISFDDHFEYVNGLGITIHCEVAHIEVRKFLGTDNVKKVIVYGRPQNI